MREMPDNGFLFGGQSSAGFRDWFVTRTDSTGDELWTYALPGMTFEPITDALVADDGIFVTASYGTLVDSNTYTSIEAVLKLGLNGDSIWVREFTGSDLYTQYISLCSDGEDGAFVLGSSMTEIGDHFHQQIRVLHMNSSGDLIWNNYYGGEGHDTPGYIYRIGEDSIAVSAHFASLSEEQPGILWLNLNGDSIGASLYSQFADSSYHGRPSLFPDPTSRGFAYFSEREDGSGVGLRWLMLDGAWNVVSEAISEPITDELGYPFQVPGGLLITGFSAYGIPERELILARLSPVGAWHYYFQLNMPSTQEGHGIGFIRDKLCVLGGDWSGGDGAAATVFFFANEGPTGYVYPSPPRLDFGVVPLDETGSITVQLHLTGDTSAVITDFTIPENFATGLHTPDTIYSDVLFEFLIGFRPTERRIYTDTLRILSTALNTELIIPMRGQGPFPILTLERDLLDFLWLHLGDSLQRQFTLRNTGTDTLFVQEFGEHPPFSFDTLGPFTILEGDSLTLNVTFHPWERGLWEHWLRFESNDPEVLDSVRLLGRCVSPNDADEIPGIPREFKLYPAYPNPFNNSTTLRFDLPRAFHVKLSLYNLQGQEVAVLADLRMNAGAHTVSLETASLASGLYFAHLVAGENVATQKLVLLK
jgi:hypothetical protein